MYNRDEPAGKMNPGEEKFSRQKNIRKHQKTSENTGRFRTGEADDQEKKKKR